MNTMDSISGILAELRLTVEGAISIYEKAPESDSDEYSLIGDALYLIREKVSVCMTACQE